MTSICAAGHEAGFTTCSVGTQCRHRGFVTSIPAARRIVECASHDPSTARQRVDQCGAAWADYSKMSVAPTRRKRRSRFVTFFRCRRRRDERTPPAPFTTAKIIKSPSATCRFTDYHMSTSVASMSPPAAFAPRRKAMEAGISAPVSRRQ